jgi:hypothetical protein
VHETDISFSVHILQVHNQHRSPLLNITIKGDIEALQEKEQTIFSNGRKRDRYPIGKDVI